MDWATKLAAAISQALVEVALLDVAKYLVREAIRLVGHEQTSVLLQAELDAVRAAGLLADDEKFGPKK